MYRLMVSYDCGTTYCSEKQADDPGEFDARCDELDAKGLRWTIGDENGNPARRACAIHAEIIAFMERVNAKAILVSDDDIVVSDCTAYETEVAE